MKAESLVPAKPTRVRTLSETLNLGHLSVDSIAWCHCQGWTDAFKPDFENMLRGEKDNFSNQHQYLFGKDFGGWAPGAPPRRAAHACRAAV